MEKPQQFRLFRTIHMDSDTPKERKFTSYSSLAYNRAGQLVAA